jgi:hypothetical protein
MSKIPSNSILKRPLNSFIFIQVPTASSARGRRKRFLQMGFQRLFAGSCGKCSNMLQVFCGIPPELLPPKGSQKGAKGSQKGAKASQKEAKGNQKGAKGSQKGAKDQENHQKSCLGAFEVFFFFFH